MDTKVVPNRALLDRLLQLVGIESYVVKQLESTQQSDLSSCGVFTIVNAWKLTRQLSLDGKPVAVINNDGGVKMRIQLARCILSNSISPLDHQENKN
jgi:Ulp1 family protease